MIGKRNDELGEEFVDIIINKTEMTQKDLTDILSYQSQSYSRLGAAC